MRAKRGELFPGALAFCLVVATAVFMLVVATSLAHADEVDEAERLVARVRWMRLYKKGGVLYHQRKYREAVPVAKEALKLAYKAFGPDHPNVVTSLDNLALLYQVQGQHAKAEPLYRRALAIKEKAYGPDHLNVVPSLSSLSILYLEQDDYIKAEPLMKRELAIYEKTVEPNHPALVTALWSMARLYEMTGREDEAKKLMARIKRIRPGK